MDKNFDKWNVIKKNIHKYKKVIGFSQYEIIFMKVGENIGYEQNGKGKDFLRPILVYKKFNNRVFLGIPLTSQPKNDKFHFEFEYKKDKRSFAILSQIKLFDIKRAKYRDGKISRYYFDKLQEKLLKLIVTPLPKEGERTKAICNNSITQKYNNVNILITGVNGQLGSELKELSSNYNYNFFFTTKEEINITNYKDVNSFINSHKIDIIINASAYTAVDKAESDVELADKVNHLAVKNLAQISKDNSIKFIHISTDYVFDGTNYKPYVEDDKTNPNSVYGKTKLDGENAIKQINPKNSIIIRTSWVYSSYGTNFVKTMLKLGNDRDKLTVIYDQVGTPTYARDLAKVILDILPQIKSDKVETYNYSNEGVLSWYDFAKEIMKMAKINCEISPIETKDYPTPASRPHYSLLNKAKIKRDFNIEIPFWKDSLNNCLITLGERK